MKLAWKQLVVAGGGAFVFLLMLWSKRQSPLQQDVRQVSTEANETKAPEQSARPQPPEERRLPWPDSGVDGGRVLSQDGKGVEGARVCWVALEEGDLQEGHPRLIGSWPVPDRPSVETTSGTDGSFTFNARPSAELPFGSVIYATHSEYLPGGADLPKGAGVVAARLVLRRSAPVLVEVFDPEGRPAQGAEVEHYGHVSGADAAGSEVKYTQFIVEKSLTPADGHVRMTRFDGEQVFLATKGTLASLPHQGDVLDKVVLSLGASFTLRGQVTSGLSGADLLSGERRLLVDGLTGNIRRPLASVAHVGDGPWGPLCIPLTGISRYTVRLEGAPILPQEVSFGCPPPNTVKSINFIGEKGAELDLHVRNEGGEPLSGAAAVAWWGNADSPLDARHVAGDVRADGHVRLGSIPPGFAQVQVTAAGYGLLEQSLQVPGEYDITLKKGGSVSGRCVHGGVPVDAFEVIYWSDSNVRMYRSRTFIGRADGTFEISSLTPGDWMFSAASPAYPTCAPLAVRVEADREVKVELELPTAIRGGGRIIDAQTAAPIATATVLVYSSGGLERSIPWGGPSAAALDGSFELNAFVLGSNYLTAAADGYADTDAKATATSGDFLDWGEIRLYRPQSLDLSLLGCDRLSGLSPIALRAFTQTGHILPEKAFTAEGTVHYDSVAPGEYQLFVSYPDDSWTRLHLQLDPGKDWHFDLKIAGDRTLNTTVMSEDGKPSLVPVPVVVTAQEDNGIFVVRLKLTSQDGRAVFEGIRAKEVQVHLLGEGGNIIATQNLSFGDAATLDAEIRIGAKPFRVHVVNPRGDGIPGCWVTMRSMDGRQIHGVDDTDSDGRATLFGLPRSQLLMDVSHGVAGCCYGVAVDASAEETEFVLDARGSLELVLLDGATPLGGVLTRIETTGGVALSETKQTDDQGVVMFQALGEGFYHLAGARADCWPVVVDRALGREEHAHVDVQMRQLADVELTAFGLQGLPVSGLPVELRSREFGVSLQTWLDAQQIRAASGLRTDVHGKIQLEGLPRGVYGWSIDLGGELVSGSFELKPGKANETAIHLPR